MFERLGFLRRYIVGRSPLCLPGSIVEGIECGICPLEQVGCSSFLGHWTSCIGGREVFVFADIGFLG